MSCKNCKYWIRASKRYGKCTMLGKAERLRHKNHVVFPMTPYNAICINFKSKYHEENIRLLDNNR